MLEGKKIAFCVTGSFCTLKKILEPVSELVRAGAEVQPIFSDVVFETDTRFGEAETWKKAFYEITGNAVWKTIPQAEPIGPKNLFDLTVVAPCTGNTLTKIALGITDSAPSMAVKATLRNGNPVVLAVSTNDGLSGSAKNLGALLNVKNMYFVPFGQDDPDKKPTSLVAHMEQIPSTVAEALSGRQLQPILK